MTAYQIFSMPKAVVIDSSVRVVAGAKANFYAHGTTTPQDTYTDSALTTPSANPVIADANGVFAPIYFDSSKAYKLTLTTSADVLIYTVDPVNDQGISGSGVGALIWPVAQIETDASVTPANFGYEWLDPRRYASVANWAAVYAQVNTLAESYFGWYRGDRAQHPQLTNCIVGFGAYDDSQMTATFGYRCTAFGVDTLKLNKNSTAAGGSNTAGGYGSMRDSVDTSGNTGWGTFTLASCTGVLSSHNGAFGNSALEALVAGTQNNGFAYRAMYQLVRGDNNTGMGDVVLQGAIAASANTCYGAQAGFTKPGGLYLNAFGYQACFHENSALVSAISKAASAVVTVSTVSVTNPFVVNDYVILNDVSGMTEINSVAGIVTAIGGSSGAWTVTVFINSTGFTTYTSGGYLSPVGNCAFGYKNQFENVYASGNSTFGHEVASTAALGIANSIYGFQAGRVINGATFNALFGWRSGLGITTGSGNCLYGQQSGISITTGSSNVCIGGNAGNAITTGGSNTAVGTGTGTADGNNRQAFGFNAQCIADNTITLGDTNIIQIRAQVTTITAISDANYKKKIQPLAVEAGFIREVPMVTYLWDNDKLLLGPDGKVAPEEDGIDWPSALQVGVVAQDLDTLQAKYNCEWLGLVDKTNPYRWEATPGKLLYPLITSHQNLFDRHDELQAAHEALRKQHFALESRFDASLELIASLAARIQSLEMERK